MTPKQNIQRVLRTAAFCTGSGLVAAIGAYLFVRWRTYVIGHQDIGFNATDVGFFLTTAICVGLIGASVMAMWDTKSARIGFVYGLFTSMAGVGLRLAYERYMDDTAMFNFVPLVRLVIIASLAFSLIGFAYHLLYEWTRKNPDGTWTYSR